MNKGYEMNLDEYHKTANYQELITILKRIGEVLNRLSCLRKKEHLLTTFFIGDIHEENILVDKVTKKIQFIDLDSCKIENNYAFNAKYLQFLKTYSCVNKELSFKYPKNRFYYDKNENTDLFCYAALILKYLFFIPLPILSLEEFYRQIYLLKEQGLPNPLYQSFLNLYTNTDNTNPYLYLEDIPSIFEKEWQRKRTL